MNYNNCSSKDLNHPRKSPEKGAALVTALLVTTLLLGICGTLLMTTSMTATNSIDSTSEMQAYYAAEAGLQVALDILRGNVAPLDGSSTSSNFLVAITPATSNYSGDTAATPTSCGNSFSSARLSKWLPYDSIFTDRVPLTSSYNTMTGTAYSVIACTADKGTEPKKILVQVTGYGPKKAIKRMDMVVAGAFLNSFTAPATITLIGTTGSPAIVSVGSSNASLYTGTDQANPTATPFPSIAVTTSTDLTVATAATTGNPEVTPAPRLISSTSIPYYVESANAARNALTDLQDVAETTNRYFTTANPPPSVGSPTSPQLTFVDGNLDISNSKGTGAGILVVTGTLTFDGGYNFQGLILVLGSGRMIRNGGGGGEISGAVLVASFDRTQYDTPFYAPTFNTNGGGNSTMIYNSSYVNRALGMTVRRTIGVVEK